MFLQQNSSKASVYYGTHPTPGITICIRVLRGRELLGWIDIKRECVRLAYMIVWVVPQWLSHTGKAKNRVVAHFTRLDGCLSSLNSVLKVWKIPGIPAGIQSTLKTWRSWHLKWAKEYSSVRVVETASKSEASRQKAHFLSSISFLPEIHWKVPPMFKWFY